VITIRVPQWWLWLLVVVLCGAVGAVGGAVAYRHGPYARLEVQLRETVSLVKEKEQQLAETSRRLQALTEELAGARRMLEQRNRELAEAQGRLRQSERERQAAAQEAARQRGIVLSRERDIYVLRTCLAGVAQSLVGVLEERYEEAAYALRTVERECRAAGKLLQ